MRSAHLVDRHFPGLESRALDLLSQVPDHEGQAQRVLPKKPRGIDGLEAGKELALLLEIGFVELRRMIAEAVVVALVPQRRCELGVGTQFVFPLFIEQRQQLLATRFDAGPRGSGDGWTTRGCSRGKRADQAADETGIEGEGKANDLQAFSLDITRTLRIEGVQCPQLHCGKFPTIPDEHHALAKCSSCLLSNRRRTAPG